MDPSDRWEGELFPCFENRREHALFVGKNEVSKFGCPGDAGSNGISRYNALMGEGVH